MSVNEISDDLLNRFMQLFTLYVCTATKSLDILKKYLKVDNPMNWRQNNIPKSGKLGAASEYSYQFHGTDCKLQFKNYEIEFEFGFDGRVGGVSSWRLFCFTEDGPEKFIELYDQNLIDSCLDQAFKKGLICKPYIDLHDDLYYLTAVRRKPDEP